jgi:hypothetical protein
VSFLLACGAESSLQPDTDENAVPPAIPDASVDAPITTDGPITPTCTPPTHMLLRNMPQGASIRPGWTGLAHNIGIPENVVYAVETFDCAEDCSLCKFRGPVQHELLPFNAQRCVRNTRLACESDEDCGGAGPCRTFYGPGIEAAVETGILGEQTVCLTLYFEEVAPNPLKPNADPSPILGTVYLDDGRIYLDSQNIKSRQQFGACNYCAGETLDEESNGKREGTCTGSDPESVIPLPCDTQGRDGKGHGFSLDCRSIGPEVGSFTLQNGPMSTTTKALELSDASPNCGGEPSSKCWCGLCTGNNPAGQVCTSNAACEERNNGTCGPAPGMKPDGCANHDFPYSPLACNVTDADHNTGTCNVRIPGSDIGPFTSFADGAPCFGGGGEIGAKLQAFGEPDPNGFNENGESFPTLASVVCVPGSGNATVDNSAGMPGVGVFEVKWQITLVGGSSGAE